MSEEGKAFTKLVKELVDKINDSGPSGLLGVDILILASRVQQALDRVEKSDGRSPAQGD